MKESELSIAFVAKHKRVMDEVNQRIRELTQRERATRNAGKATSIPSPYSPGISTPSTPSVNEPKPYKEATVRAMQELQERIRSEPNHIHAMGIYERNSLGWKWRLYLPKGKRWQIKGKVGRIPRNRDFPEDNNAMKAIDINPDATGKILEFSGYVTKTASQTDWLLQVEADTMAFKGVDFAIWSMRRSPPASVEQKEAVDYILGERNASFIGGGNSLGVGNVTTKLDDRLQLVRWVFQAGDQADTQEGPGLILWIEEKKQKEDAVASPIESAVKRLLSSAGEPAWRLASFGERPTVAVNGFRGHQVVLRRTWNESTDPTQVRQVELPGGSAEPLDEKHEDWRFILIPIASQPAPANLKSQIPWGQSNSPHHTQAVCMGEGFGFVWYSNGTIFGQETIREKLNLTGGDDRIELLLAGMRIEDKGSITANTCQQLIARFGDEALGPIETAIENASEPTALRRLIGSLAFIRTDASTELLMRLHQSEKEEVNAAADYALIGIELATYTAKGPQQRVNEAGIDLLLTRPRDEVTEYLQSVSKVMSAENAEQVRRLLRRMKQQEQLQRLKSHGILVTPGGIGDTSYRYVVSSDFRGGKPVIDDLLQYCVNFNPKSEVVFFGPVVTDDQLRQFQLLIPKSHVRHMAAVWLNIVATVSDDESERKILRVSDVGSPAREIGLQVGDVIVGIGDFRWPESESRDAFNAAMRTQIPGQKSKVVVSRDGENIMYPLTWEESTAHRLLCGNTQAATQRHPIQAAKPDVDQASMADNLQALTGKWKATEASHHLLESKLVEANETGFEITIDKQLGESYRRTSDTYENQYKAFLKKKGHAAVASGTIKFDYGGESELMISRKGGSFFLWYGVVNGGNPRIVLHAGADKSSLDSFAIEWTSLCSDSPVDLDRESATVVYQRPHKTTVSQTDFQTFADQVVNVAVATVREAHPTFAEADLADRLAKRIRMIVEDARATVEKRPQQWRTSLVENLKSELHSVCVAKSFGAEYRERLDFYVGLKTVEWKLWQAVNREPAEETTSEVEAQLQWLRDYIVSLPETPIPGTQYPSYMAILDQLAAEIANPMQPMFKVALPREQFAEVRKQLKAETGEHRPVGKDRVFNDSLLVVLPFFVRHELPFRWGLRAADTDKSRLPFSKEEPFVGHSKTSIIFQHLTEDYPYPEQIEPFRLAENLR
ncbi:MAG: hypothetical protein R3C05_10430 [Pirellulaceae bacterium]